MSLDKSAVSVVRVSANAKQPGWARYGSRCLDMFLPLPPVVKPVRFGRVDLVVAVVTLCIVLWVARPALFTAAYPWGSDVLHHLYKVWYLAEHWSRYGTLAQWTPHWYNGTPITQYSPPLSYYLMLPLQLLLGDVAVVYRLFVGFMVFGAAFLTYFLFASPLGRPAAAFAGLVYVLSPYSIRTVFSEGDLPRTLALVVLPVALRLLLKIVDDGRRRDFVLLSPVVSALVVSHDLVALAFLICFGGSLLLHGLIVDRRGLDRVVMGLAAMLLGVGLSSWWFIPSGTGFDLSDVPNFFLMAEKRLLYSADWSVIHGALGPVNLEAAYLGLVLMVLGVLGAAVQPDRFSVIVGVAGGIAFLLAFGAQNPIAAYLPMSERIYPERFLHVTTLALALLSARLLRRILALRRPALALPLSLLMASMVMVDIAPYWALVKSANYGQMMGFTTSLSGEWNAGRLVDQAGIPGATLFPTVLDGLNQTYGSSPEATPHLADIIAVNQAVKMDYLDFVVSTYALWNARFALISDNYAGLISRLQQAGFRPKQYLNNQVLLRWDKPSSYFMVQDRDVLVIGRGASGAAMLFPWAAQAASWFVDDYDLEYLSRFKVILLYDYRYRDIRKVEGVLRQLVDYGTVVVVDFANKDDEYLFDVTAYGAGIVGDYVLERETDQGLFGGLDLRAGPFSDDGRPWRGPGLVGLDSVMLSLTAEDVHHPVVGYKKVGSGRVYFIGFNLLTFAFQTHDLNLAQVVGRLLDLGRPNKAIVPRDFEVSAAKWEHETISFAYDARQSVPVIVSTTYSPHWRATVDGIPVRLYEHERLILVLLPQGRHTVQLAYGWTWVQAIGLGVSALSLLGVILGAIFLPLKLQEWLLWSKRRVRTLLLGVDVG